MNRSADALERFERLTSWPMLVLSIVFVVLLVAPLAVDLSPGVLSTLEALDWMIWAAFALEYGIRLYLAPRKLAFMRRNVVDLVVVVVPFLRPIRVVRSARALRLLRAGRAATFLLRAVDAGRDVLRRHHLGHVMVVTLVVVVGAGIVVAEVERQVDGSIRTVADGLWWAVTTVTTVGYGDKYPVTPVGRGIAVGLMFLGVGLFGLLAASLASYFVERHQDESTEPALKDVVARLDAIEETLRRLELGLPAPRE